MSAAVAASSPAGRRTNWSRSASASASTGQSSREASRLVAKVDSAAVQDGFDLYLHGFIVTDDGKWVVVQQGMKGEAKLARRYHWLSEGLTSFVDAPHAAIEGAPVGEMIVNLADRRAAASRAAQLDLIRDLGPDRISRECRRCETGTATGSAAAAERIDRCCHTSSCRSITMSAPAMWSCAVCTAISPRRRIAGPPISPSCCSFRGSARAPSAPWRWWPRSSMARHVGSATRPASRMAHGGKDGHPFPVPLKVYDETIRVLKSAVQAAKLGQAEQLGALERLDAQARRLERHASGPSLDALHGRGARELAPVRRAHRFRLGEAGAESCGGLG